MPIYEYRCTACQFANEYLQKISEPPLSTCPECGQETFTKLVSAAGFQLKGSGWYVTDFKNSAAKKVESTSSKAAATDASEGKASGADSKTSSTENKPSSDTSSTASTAGS